ncbi:hypothetical protein KC19_8G001900 [Ceratodon purpureus]|uniref:Uncharacterized protein n=1 Tax=Ceratodon purpureus TaxID=3225 RepID=A0A8T0GTN2_CERPU|nr:hypothetical protein KC19_8G001900 [Ceratodon purpureus]
MGDAVRNLEEQIRDVEGEIQDVKQKIDRVEQQIERVQEQIERVQEQIERVQEQIETCSNLQERARLDGKEARLLDEKAQLRAEKAQLRAEKSQLRDERARLDGKEERLRAEKAQLREQIQHGRGLSSAVPEKLLQDLTEYLAEQKAKQKSKKSVCLSSVSQSIWDTLQRQEGLKMTFKAIGSEPKCLSDLPAFGWDDRLEKSQADRYIVHLNQIKRGREWKLIDAANKHPTLLSGSFGGWNFKGTTDVAFVHRTASRIMERSGLKCIFELKKELRGGGHQKACIQTVICLVMANLFAPQFKPCAVLTDLDDTWSLFWMDGSTIFWFTFESRASAVGYIEELLQDSDGNEMGTSEALASYAHPHGENEDLQFIKKRRMYEPPEMDNLKDLVGLIPDEEILSARVQIGVQQLQKLLHTPMFSGVPDVDMPWPSHMYS